LEEQYKNNLTKIMSKIPKKNFYAIIGVNPSKGARSPLLWNKFLKKEKKKIKMIPLDVEIKECQNSIKKILRNKNFYGGAVAVPYKEVVAKLLNQANLSLSAKEIGAVNCIFRKKGQIYGENTDGLAFLETLNLFKSDYKKILILGFGGAGKAVYFTLKKNTKDKNIAVILRSKKTIKEMKKRNIKCYHWKRLDYLINTYDVIVNCTSVGYLNEKETPILEKTIKKLKKKKLFYDIIYQPLETKLLKIAKKYNHGILNGLNMNILQACIAISMATGDKNLRKIQKIISE
jgi:shikimate dehydrogenase